MSANTKRSSKKVDHPLHSTWSGMHQRCRNKNAKCWPRYGGRGIRVCKRWSGTKGFYNFVVDMGPRPTKNHSLDRINNDGNYSPSNCRWATRKEQRLNSSQIRMVTVDGKTI